MTAHTLTYLVYCPPHSCVHPLCHTSLVKPCVPSCLYIGIKASKHARNFTSKGLSLTPVPKGNSQRSRRLSFPSNVPFTVVPNTSTFVHSSPRNTKQLKTLQNGRNWEAEWKHLPALCSPAPASGGDKSRNSLQSVTSPLCPCPLLPDIKPGASRGKSHLLLIPDHVMS